jgi:hypothetical protein
MDDSAETSLVFHNDAGNAHLATKGEQEDDELDCVAMITRAAFLASMRGTM